VSGPVKAKPLDQPDTLRSLNGFFLQKVQVIEQEKFHQRTLSIVACLAMGSTVTIGMVRRDKELPSARLLAFAASPTNAR
jgi:hypothetical protein